MKLKKRVRFPFPENFANERWVVVADPLGAKILKAARGNPLSVFETLQEPSATEELARTPVNGNVANAFARRLAAFIEQARSTHKFKRLILISEPQFLGKLRAHLSKKTMEIIDRSIKKDLFHLGERELLPRVGLLTGLVPRSYSAPIPR